MILKPVVLKIGFSPTFSSDDFFRVGLDNAKDLDNARDFGVGSQPKAKLRGFHRENRVGQPFFV